MKNRQAQSPSASRQRNGPPSPVFSDDLIVEILSWLPVKSLLKFRCVCKSWKSLISVPNFVKSHLHRSARNPNLLLAWENFAENVEDISLGVVPCSVRSLVENPDVKDVKDDCFQLNGTCGYQVVGSCNGLVCYYRTMNPRYKFCFYLWNPATKLTSKKLTCLRVRDSCFYYRLRFAFGYDNLSDTYKVVALWSYSKAKEESPKNQVKICSFGDKRWRNIDSLPVDPFDSSLPEMNNGVYFNGTLNWLALPNNDIGDGTSTIAQLVIVSLDLGMETYTQLLLPRLDEVPVHPTVCVLMDCLCFSHHWKENHLVIWQMKEFGVEKSWTQFMKVSSEDLQIDYVGLYYPLLPLGMSENGDVLMMATLVELQAILYHRKDNRVELLDFEDNMCWKSTLNYVESLVSPCCN